MNKNFAKCSCALFLFCAITSGTAQSTWSYNISDAGNGNSLITWSVTGSLITPPGVVLQGSESSLTFSINYPGIYADTYVTAGTPQLILTPDGSLVEIVSPPFAPVLSPIDSYYTDNAPGNGNDGFGLIVSWGPNLGSDPQLFYGPGTQSIIIPVDFSSFTPGTYQSIDSGLDTPLTVNLTVEPAPEPSALALFAVCGLCALRLCRPPNNSPEPPPIAFLVPHSRLTDLAARLSFCR